MANEEPQMELIEVENIQAELNSFIGEVISQYQSQHEVTVLHYHLYSQNTSYAGRHYTSSVHILNLTVTSDDGEESQSSIILKIPHLSSSYECYRKVGMYEKETFMYKRVLPRLYRIWHCEIMAPYFYAASNNDILAMEDLTERGFRVLPKDSRLDLSECEIVLERLAQFHGLSVKYFELYGTEDFEKLKILPSNCDFTMKALIGKIEKYILPSLSASQRDTWVRFERNYKTLSADAYTSHNVGGFNVIIHGNLHSRNLLFKEDLCKFIDFQLSRQGSPLLDLICFIVYCVKWEVFELHREYLFNHYLRVLDEVLKRVGSERRYSLKELHADFEKYKLFCVFVLSFHVPISWSGVEDAETINETRVNRIDTVMQSAEYISLFKNWVEVFQQGWKTE